MTIAQDHFVVASMPFIPQRALEPRARTCGAAALTMAYRSLERNVRVEEVWAAVRSRGRRVAYCATTRRMAQDALMRGLTAMIVQAAAPIHVVMRALERGARVVINHRLHARSTSGHYSLVVDADDRHVWRHDPQFGPDRMAPWHLLLDLWRPVAMGEIAGYVAIAIAREPDEAWCDVCGAHVPTHAFCRSCRRRFPLVASLLACRVAACRGALWRQVFCPACDYPMAEIA